MSRQAAKLTLYPEVIARLGRRGQVLEGMWAGKVHEGDCGGPGHQPEDGGIPPRAALPVVRGERPGELVPARVGGRCDPAGGDSQEATEATEREP